jgi:signal transduction histidine kinase
VAEGYPFLNFTITGKALVMADSSLFSVIDNIVRNAVIHGKADTFEVSINRREDTCEVLIADNGTGIPTRSGRDLRRGVHIRRNRTYGLGLHIVKRVMET